MFLLIQVFVMHTICKNIFEYEIEGGQVNTGSVRNIAIILRVNGIYIIANKNGLCGFIIAQ